MIEDKEISINNQTQKDELDLISRIKAIWNGRRKIIKITLVFAFIGLFIAIFSEKEYTASTTIIPQVSSAKKLGGNLGGLAAIAGIDIGGSSKNDSNISPLLYPHIVNSVPFQKELLATQFTIVGYTKPVTFKEYYTDIYKSGLLSKIKQYTIGLPGIIYKAIKGKSVKSSLQLKDVNSQIVYITAEEKQLIERLKKQLTLIVNKKEGYISLSASMPEALNAAELTQNAQEILQKYIINFKVQKSKNQLSFIKQRFYEKEKIYKEAQIKLASFQDRNQFMNSALAKNTQTRYQAEYDLAFGVYSEIAKQQETQLIKVKEDTPIFTILEPVSIPTDKSKPKRAKTIFIFTFLGFIIGLAFVFSKSYITLFMSKMRND
jgi:LPS O-antigen subunit length determinant protein (WzzB/FepE family)